MVANCPVFANEDNASCFYVICAYSVLYVRSFDRQVVIKEKERKGRVFI